MKETEIEYQKQACYYDVIYDQSNEKNYAAEAEVILKIIKQHPSIPKESLLDVGCGTGNHLKYFQQWFKAEGLDISSQMIEMSKQKLPNIKFHLGDMSSFNLSQSYDIITCLFGSIGWTKTLEKMELSIVNMAKHLNKNGLLIVEPWFTPETWKNGLLSSSYAESENLAVARMSISSSKDRLSILDFHFLVGSSKGIERFKERHEIGLFTLDEYKTAFNKAGLKANYQIDGVDGRGLFVAQKND